MMFFDQVLKEPKIVFTCTYNFWAFFLQIRTKEPRSETLIYPYKRKRIRNTAFGYIKHRSRGLQVKTDVVTVKLFSGRVHCTLYRTVHIIWHKFDKKGKNGVYLIIQLRKRNFPPILSFEEKIFFSPILSFEEKIFFSSRVGV